MMNLEQMQSMWQAHSEKLDESMSLNNRLLKEMRVADQKNKLNKLVISRAIEGFLFIIITVFLWRYIVSSWSLTAPVLSAVLLNVFAIIGLAGSIGQIALLTKIDFAKPIKETLTDLIAVRSHSLSIFKLLMFSAPFYMAYVFLGYDMAFGVDLFSLMSVETKSAIAAISVVFGGLVALLISKLKPENRGNRLIDWLYREVAGERLTHLLDEINHLESEKR